MFLIPFKLQQKIFTRMACHKPELTKVRKKLSNSSGTCRVCMKNKNFTKALFGPDSKIVERILFCTGIHLTESPILPSSICSECYSQLNIAHYFKTTCMESDNKYRQFDVKIEIKTEKFDKPTVKEEVEVEYLYEDEALINNLQDTGLINKNIPDSIVPKIEKAIPTTSSQTIKLKVVNVSANSFDSLCKKEKKIPKKKENKKMIPRKKPESRYIFTKLCCRKCNIQFDTKEDSMQHYQDVHNVPKSICEICGKELLKHAVYQHMRVHEKASLQCDHCSYTTSYKADLKKHLTIHTGERKYQCDACPLSFRTSSNLHAHIRFKHIGKRTFSCEHCNKTFVSQDCLNKHSLTHKQTKRFSCNLCDSRFNWRGGWKRHILNFHAVKVPRAKPGPRRNKEETPSLFYKENDKINKEDVPLSGEQAPEKTPNVDG